MESEPPYKRLVAGFYADFHCQASGAEPLLHDRDNTLRVHVGFQLPTVEEIASVSERVARVQSLLNHLTRKGS